MHEGMPFERQPGAAESGIVARADSARWTFFEGAAVQFTGLLRQTGMPNAANRKPGAGFLVGSQRAGEGAGHRLATAAAALRPAAI